MSKLESATKEIMNAPPKSVEESLFISKYLPLLFHTDPRAFNKIWINEISNSPHTPVSIIRDGIVVDTVPPLRAAIETKLNPEISMLLSALEFKKNQHGLIADRFLKSNIARLINLDGSNTDIHRKEWEDLVTRYGYGQYIVSDNNSSNAVETYQLIEDDDD